MKKILCYKNSKLGDYSFKKINYTESVVLPSYYRECIPRTLLEALSVGRGIITTNSVGCREVVINEENGFLIERRNVNDLIRKMEKIILNKELVLKFSIRSRIYAEERFNVKIVNNEIIKLLEKT